MQTAHLKVQTEYMTENQAARQFPLVGGGERQPKVIKCISELSKQQRTE